MADKSDVENTLVEMLVDAFQITNASVVALSTGSLNSNPIKISIFRGWPTNDQLQQDVVAAGGLYVSIFTPAVSSTTTRHQETWNFVSKADLTVSATVSGASVTISGIGTLGNNLGIAYGSTGWSYRPSAGQTAESIAGSLGALIPNATVAGATINLATNLAVSSDVVGDVVSCKEVMCSRQRFTMSVWATDTLTRDAAANLITQTVAAANWLTLDDGTQTQPPKYMGSPDFYADQNFGVNRRDVNFDIEFPLYVFQTDPAILFVGAIFDTVKVGIFPPV
jgi:hypothetical protein